jgi:hypothetical protein
VIAFYELFNEPVSGNDIATREDWLLWKTFAEELIDIIRVNDPDCLVIVGGLQWGYDLSYVLSFPVERENIVYATHPYPGTEWNRSWDEAFGKIKNQYPVFATEFGFEMEGYFTEDLYHGDVRYSRDICAPENKSDYQQSPVRHKIYHRGGFWPGHGIQDHGQ